LTSPTEKFEIRYALGPTTLGTIKNFHLDLRAGPVACHQTSLRVEAQRWIRRSRRTPAAYASAKYPWTRVGRLQFESRHLSSVDLGDSIATY